jgi:hypothetical protein
VGSRISPLVVVALVLAPCAGMLPACEAPPGTVAPDLGSPAPPNDAAAALDATAGDGAPLAWWGPAPGTSWQWQLQGTIDTTVDAHVYDIDLFDAPQSVIDALHAQGRRVVCYLDTAYEPNRPDSTQLAPYIGNPVQGWPGQYWLDIRSPQVVAILDARIALAQQKRCDAIEADDVDSRQNNPGFPITAADQQSFIRGLAARAHELGLGYALKNDLDEIPALLGDVDFAVNEECFAFAECDLLAPFIAAGKAVFQVEYTAGDLATAGATVCPQANARNFDTLIKHDDLGAPRFACR